MFCENCGNKNLENDKFCENCGNSLVQDENNHISINNNSIKIRKKFQIIYPILFIILIGEYFIYNLNNQLSLDIRYMSSSNNSIRNNISNIQEERRLAHIRRQDEGYNQNNSKTVNVSQIIPADYNSKISGNDYTAVCSDGNYGMVVVEEDGMVCASGNGKSSKCSYNWGLTSASSYICR